MEVMLLFEGGVRADSYLPLLQRNGRQAPEGESGHFNACWGHSVSDSDVRSIKEGGSG